MNQAEELVTRRPGRILKAARSRRISFQIEGKGFAGRRINSAAILRITRRTITQDDALDHFCTSLGAPAFQPTSRVRLHSGSEACI